MVGDGRVRVCAIGNRTCATEQSPIKANCSAQFECQSAHYNGTMNKALNRRETRARLSPEQFSIFLNNIKDLNNHRQTREETMSKVSGSSRLHRLPDGMLIAQ